MIYPLSDKTLDEAAHRLLRGDLVAFPTETVYGLGALAANESAIEKIFILKGRPRTNPLIVHLLDTSSIDTIARIPDQKLFEAVAQFWPGPLTLILPARPNGISPTITAGKNSVAVRIPQHPASRSLLQRVAAPVVAPSANRSERVSPTEAAHVKEDFNGEDLFILDGGSTPLGIESTVLSLLGSSPKILRHGSISAESIASTLSMPVSDLVAVSVEDASHSPGNHIRHYAPTTPLFLESDKGWKVFGVQDLAYISLSEKTANKTFPHQWSLSTNGDDVEIARNLYSTLRAIDALGFEAIVTEVPSATGVGRAIVDRLVRASTKNS